MNNDSVQYVEEDWSEIMAGETTGFAQHNTVVVRLSSSRTLSMACVAALSPLDMMNLSQGDHDATGHRIWLGAYLFIEALEKSEFIKSLFRRDCTVVELGCGSGVSGLALLRSDPSSSPSLMVFTDSDPAALELCRRNCRCNLRRADDKNTRIECLEWGDSLNQIFDVVLATDVLYDISSLDPMLDTVVSSLNRNGYLVMSHVPRSSLPGRGKVASAEELEAFIVENARKHNLNLTRFIRPADMYKQSFRNDTLNDVSFQEMEESGAAILVFKVGD